MPKFKSMLFISVNAVVFKSFAQTNYLPPLSKTTLERVPVISDKKMEECVVLYNELEWLSTNLKSAVVERYSEEAINNYNQEVNKHTAIMNSFNSQCAGK